MGNRVDAGPPLRRIFPVGRHTPGNSDPLAARREKLSFESSATCRVGWSGIAPANGGFVRHSITITQSKGENIMRSIIHYTNPRSASLLPSLGFGPSWAGLESDFDRLFETAISSFAAPARDNNLPIDRFEDKDNTYVRAELPGVNRNDINVEMVDGYLTISATLKSLAGEGKGEETFSFSRSVSIPENVHNDKVSATCENGVLTVTLPKQEEAKPKKIAITVK
jgi:HSP20 family protein